MSKKIGIQTFEKFEGRKGIGSSRIRARWIANHWEDAEIYKSGQKYDIMIYQKCYWIDHAKNFDGIKILDLCDPDWLHWAYRVKEMIDLCDAVTTSTEALAESIRKFTDKPVVCIPDRLDLDEFKNKKIHCGRAKTALWYGYSNNATLLYPVINYLIKHNLNLIVLSDKQVQIQRDQAEKIKVDFYKYNEETANNNIIKGDFVINPKSKSGKWKYKSNNKTITALALGVPVVETPKDIERFLDPDERNKEINDKTENIRKEYDVKNSIKQYNDLIDEIKKSKKINTEENPS